MRPPNRVNSIPLLGQREQQAKAQIHAAISQLAMHLYSQVVIAHIDASEALDAEATRRIARNSFRAAECYFEETVVKGTGKENAIR